MKKSILFIVNEASSILMHRKDLILICKNKDFKVAVAYMDDSKKEDLSEMRDIGIEFYNLNLKRKNIGIYQSLVYLYKLFHIFKKREFLLIHSFGVYSYLIISILTLYFRNQNIISTIAGRGSFFLSKKFWLKTQLLRFFFKFFSNNKKHKLIFHNKDDQIFLTRYFSLNPSKTIVIRGSGVDTSLFSPLPKKNNEELHVGFVGRFIIDKGVNKFIEVAKNLTKKFPNVTFNLVGSIDEGNPSSLKSKDISRLNRYKNICCFSLNQKDMPNFYKGQDIICLPSKHEGLPRAIIEACSTGVPCVVTNVPGCREVIKDSYNGFLVELDDQKGLESSISNLIKDEKLREELGENGRKFIKKNFELKKILDIHISLYLDILNDS